MSEAIVAVSNLSKVFNGAVVVDSVSFTVKRGEIVGLLGPNGAGKTTVVHMLLGLTTRSRGSVAIFGQDPELKRVEILQRCNFASAYVHLPFNLRVWENLIVFAELYRVKGYKQKIEHLLKTLEISHLSNSINGRLSSGEATRVNLCKALLNDPELLILDEPTASLDPDIADKVRKLLKSLQKEKDMTMIYTSHNMKDVQEVCDRVLFMHKGQIIAEGTPDEIMDKFKQKSLDDVFIRVARSDSLLVDEETTLADIL